MKTFFSFINISAFMMMFSYICAVYITCVHTSIPITHPFLAPPPFWSPLFFTKSLWRESKIYSKTLPSDTMTVSSNKAPSPNSPFSYEFIGGLVHWSLWSNHLLVVPLTRAWASNTGRSLWAHFISKPQQYLSYKIFRVRINVWLL